MPRNLAIVASLSLLSIAAAAHTADAHHHDIVRRSAKAHPVARLVRTAQPSRTAPVVVYLNRNGGTVGGGDDDAANDRSWLVPGRTAKVPAFSGGDGRWAQTMKCVKDRFSAFNIEVTDERPQQAGYIMAMVGGGPRLLNMGNEVSGIAPFTGEVERNAIVFVFAENVENDPETVCVDAIHEVGHALGLDHEYLCQDPMSYLWDCEEPKEFQNVAAPCGEDAARACDNGPTQNSWQTLARNVGLRNEDDTGPVSAPPAQVPATPPAQVDDGSDSADDGGDDPVDDSQDPAATDPGDQAAPADSGDGGGDDTADPNLDNAANPFGDEPTRQPGRLSITVTGPAGTIRGNRTIQIKVHSHGVGDATLGWISPSGSFAIQCSAIPDDSPARCSRHGDEFIFELDVGVGWRYFAARVTDSRGHSVTSDFQQLLLR
jgi:hypothetical protein